MNTLPSNRDRLIACVARASLLLAFHNRGKGLDPRTHCLEQYFILELAQHYGAVNHATLRKFLGVTFDRTIYSWLGNFCSSHILVLHPAAEIAKELRNYSLSPEGEKMLVRLREEYIGAVVFPTNAAGLGREFSDVDVVTESLSQQGKELKKH
jgi:hypothetical protein